MSVAERISRRRRNGSRASREYIIHVASSEADAIDQLLAAAPTTLDGFARLDAQTDVEEIEDSAGEYYGTAVWGSATGFEFQPPDSFELSFDISSESVHVTQSLETVASYAASGVAIPDYHGAINVTAEGTIEGVDIDVSTFTYCFSLAVDDADMTQSYVLALSGIVGKVNDGTFHGFPAGELRLLSAAGQRRQDGNWSITFRMAVSKNVSGLVIPSSAGPITVTTKDGWDYLWVRYGFGVSSNVLTRDPFYAYVERVDPRTDYAGIFP
jgi:hypothetical protein